MPPLIAQLLHLIEDAPRGRDRLIDWLRQYRWARPLVQTVRAVPLNDLVVARRQHPGRLLGATS